MIAVEGTIEALPLALLEHVVICRLDTDAPKPSAGSVVSLGKSEGDEKGEICGLGLLY